MWVQAKIYVLSRFSRILRLNSLLQNATAFCAISDATPCVRQNNASLFVTSDRELEGFTLRYSHWLYRKASTIILRLILVVARQIVRRYWSCCLEWGLCFAKQTWLCRAYLGNASVYIHSSCNTPFVPVSPPIWCINYSKLWVCTEVYQATFLQRERKSRASTVCLILCKTVMEEAC